MPAASTGVDPAPGMTSRARRAPWAGRVRPVPVSKVRPGVPVPPRHRDRPGRRGAVPAERRRVPAPPWPGPPPDPRRTTRRRRAGCSRRWPGRRVADDVGHALGLHLSDPPVVVALVRVVEPHVRQLMGQGLDRLGRLDIGPDGDGAGEVVGAAVRPTAVAPLQAEAGFGHLVGQGVPQAVWGLAVEQGGADVGKRLAVGLGDVPHVRTRKPRRMRTSSGSLGRLLVVDRPGPVTQGARMAMPRSPLRTWRPRRCQVR
jgi:hypothetical protein